MWVILLFQASWHNQAYALYFAKQSTKRKPDPAPRHDSGLERFANPLLCGSFIRYSMPVLTGAFSDPSLASPDCQCADWDIRSRSTRAISRLTSAMATSCLISI